MACVAEGACGRISGVTVSNSESRLSEVEVWLRVCWMLGDGFGGELAGGLEGVWLIVVWWRWNLVWFTVF